MPRHQMRLSDAIDEFLASRAAQGYAKNTTRSQRTALLRLLTTVGNIYVDSIEARHMDAFFGSQVDRWGTGTMNLARTHASTFFTWCRGRQVMSATTEPLVNSRKRRYVQRDRLRIPVGEFSRLLDYATHPRDRMVVAMGLFLFLRAGEITSLRLRDVHLDLNEIAVTVHKQGGTVDQMPIALPLRHELAGWMTYYTTMVGPLRPDMYLTPGLRTLPGVYDYDLKRLQPQVGAAVLAPAVHMTHPERVVKAALEKMGHETWQEGCHTLRRSGARALFDEIADSGSNDRALEIVSSMLHHKSLSTTQLYLGLTESRIRRDDLLKGQIMFSGMDRGNVVQMADAR